MSGINGTGGVKVGELLRECVKALEAAGNDNPRFEAEQLVMKFCGVKRSDILMFPGLEATAEQAAEVRGAVQHRNSGEPLQYILGEWEFYGLPFYVGEGVLIPRQDTETLVETAARFLRERPGVSEAADLCAGSGCVGITLAKLTGIPVKLLELSEQALGYLRRNIALNGAEELCEAMHADVLSDDTAAGMPQLDLIVTNPPYLTAQDMRELQPEVTHEPETALFGGDDGLDYYRRMVPLWGAKLNPGGMLAAEIGIGQHEDVTRIFEENGLRAGFEKDLCGVIRVIYGIKQ